MRGIAAQTWQSHSSQGGSSRSNIWRPCQDVEVANRDNLCHEIGGNLKIWTAKFDQWRAAVTVKLGMELVAEGDEVHAENNGKEYQADEEGPGMSSSAYESSGVDIDDEEDVALQMQTLENICTVCM